jgi:broad specificity phosphatase PhoE
MRMRRLMKTSLLAFLVLLAPGAVVSPEAQGSGSLRLYIARHGETDWNLAHRLQGWTDRPLDDTGRRQALDLAESLKGIHLDAIYSSTLSRSRDTAEAVAGTTMTVKSLPGLRERNYGRFQGGLETDPDYVRRVTAWDDAMDGGETLTQLLARARESVEMIRREHPTGNVLIVSHRITNQMILRALMNLTPEQAVKIEQGNDEVYLVEFRLWKLVREKNLGDL